MPARLSPMGYFLLFTLGIEIASRSLWLYKTNNLPVLHLYTLGEFILISFIYKKAIPDLGLFAHKNFYLAVVGISILIILNTIIYQPLNEFNSYSKSFVQFIIIAYAILFFFNYKEENEIGDHIHKFYKLLNSGILVYYSGSLFIFMFSNIFLGDNANYTGLWAINALLYLVFQIIILISLWKLTYTPQKSYH